MVSDDVNKLVKVYKIISFCSLLILIPPPLLFSPVLFVCDDLSQWSVQARQGCAGLNSSTLMPWGN